MFELIEVEPGEFPVRSNEALISRFVGERIGLFRLRDQRKEVTAQIGMTLKPMSGFVSYQNDRGALRIAMGIVTIAPQRHVRIGELLLKPMESIRAGQVFFVHALPH